MSQYSSDIAFTSSVKAVQTEKGSRANYVAPSNVKILRGELIPTASQGTNCGTSR